jgi:hypothetical protein
MLIEYAKCCLQSSLSHILFQRLKCTSCRFLENIKREIRTASMIEIDVIFCNKNPFVMFVSATDRSISWRYSILLLTTLVIIVSSLLRNLNIDFIVIVLL